MRSNVHIITGDKTWSFQLQIEGTQARQVSVINLLINIGVSGININIFSYDLINTLKIWHLMPRSHESWSVSATRSQKCVSHVHMYANGYARENESHMRKYQKSECL